MRYNDLKTDREREIYDQASLNVLGDFEDVIKAVHKNNPYCDNIKIKDFYTIVNEIKKRFNKND